MVKIATRMTKKRILSLLKIIVSVGLLILVFSRVGWSAVVSALEQASLGWLALALAVYILGVFVRAVRWRILLPKSDLPGIRTRRLVQLYFVSFFFNTFLPTGIGGDVVRIAEVSPAVGGATAASSVIADRAIGLVSTGLLALFALPFVRSSLSLPFALVTAITAIGIPAAFWLLRRYGSKGWSATNRLPALLGPLVNRAGKVAKTLAAYSQRELGLALAVSLVFAFTNVLTYACIGRALQVDLSLAYYTVVSPVITLMLLIPLSFNGLGIRDITYQALFVPAGVAPDDALAMSLVYHAFNLITAVIGGVVYALMGIAETASRDERARLAAAEQASTLPAATGESLPRTESGKDSAV